MKNEGVAVKAEKKREELEIGGQLFEWEMEKGTFLFDGQDAMLFWISGAMTTIFDTIEEISGEDSSDLVLETAGYRQGLMVGKYFIHLKELSINEVADQIMNTYASAGWGLAKVLNLDKEKKTCTVELQNTWEHKMNVEQGKSTGGCFLPAHYAGVFTELFGVNIWYQVVHSQIEGYSSTIVNYFPSTITVKQNIHELARKKDLEQIKELERLVDHQTNYLQSLITEISSPIIPVLEGIVVVPLIGRYDENRSDELIRKTLFNLPLHQAHYLILDVTAISKEVSDYTIEMIRQLAKAANLLGTETILVGISAEFAIAIAENNFQLDKINCYHSLQHGIYYALSQQGKRIL